MNCWRCTAKIPDGTEICPICSAIQVLQVNPLNYLKGEFLCQRKY